VALSVTGMLAPMPQAGTLCTEVASVVEPHRPRLPAAFEARPIPALSLKTAESPAGTVSGRAKTNVTVASDGRATATWFRRPSTLALSDRKENCAGLLTSKVTVLTVSGRLPMLLSLIMPPWVGCPFEPDELLFDEATICFARLRV
jgi:hypothetical protein